MSIENDILSVLSEYSATNRCSYSDLFDTLTDSYNYDAAELTENLQQTLETLISNQDIKMINQRSEFTMGTFYRP